MVVGVYGVLLCVLDLLQLAVVVGVYGVLLCVLDLLHGCGCIWSVAVCFQTCCMVVGVYGVLLCVFRGHAAYGSGVQLLRNKTEVGGR